MIPTAFGVLAAGSGSAVGTWNPANKSANVTLSGGNLIATVPNNVGYSMAIGTLAFASSVKFNVLVTSAAEASVGLAAAGTNKSGYVGNTNYSIGLYQDGRVFSSDGGEIDSITGYPGGGRVWVDYDFAGSQVRFKVDSSLTPPVSGWSSWYSTATLVGPLYAAAALGLSGSGGGTATLAS